PYAGHISELMPQPTVAAGTQPQTSFFRHNGLTVTPPTAANSIGPNTLAGQQTIKVPFDWLTHLDRKLTSPMELLHVSGFKPHELTQQFMIQPPNPGTGFPPEQQFMHRAPWFDSSARIHRAFEFLTTAD